QRSGRTQGKRNMQARRRRALTRQIEQRRVDVDSVHAMAVGCPQTALGARAAADVGHVHAGGRIGQLPHDGTPDRCKAFQRRGTRTAALVIAVKAGMGCGIPGVVVTGWLVVHGGPPWRRSMIRMNMASLLEAPQTAWDCEAFNGHMYRKILQTIRQL